MIRLLELLPYGRTSFREWGLAGAMDTVGKALAEMYFAVGKPSPGFTGDVLTSSDKGYSLENRDGTAGRGRCRARRNV